MKFTQTSDKRQTTPHLHFVFHIFCCCYSFGCITKRILNAMNVSSSSQEKMRYRIHINSTANKRNIFKSFCLEQKMRVEFLAILVETQRPPKQSFVWYLNIWIWTSNAALDAFNNMTCIPLYVQKPPVELKSHNIRVGIGYPWQSLAAHKTSVKNAVIVS